MPKTIRLLDFYPASKPTQLIVHEETIQKCPFAQTYCLAVALSSTHILLRLHPFRLLVPCSYQVRSISDAIGTKEERRRNEHATTIYIHFLLKTLVISTRYSTLRAAFPKVLSDGHRFAHSRTWMPTRRIFLPPR